jgi:phage tail sheath gpL-like
MSFSFTRAPSTKVSIAIDPSGLVAADNELFIIGRRAASGGTATNGAVNQIANFGDPTLAQAECDALFGAGAEITEMIIAAIKGNLFSDKSPQVFPPIKAVCQVSTAVSSDLAATLAGLIALPMPHVVVPFPITDATARAALIAHLTAISGDDRGVNGQFGSFGYMATDAVLSTATAAGEAAASQLIVAPWLRDGAGSKANKIHAVAAAFAAVCAGNSVPFNPLNDLKVGGLVAPASVGDYHTTGDAGSVALGLASGLVPLYIGSDGSVKVSRTVTASRRVAASPDSAYFDQQDWQVLYYFRKNAWLNAQRDVYKRAKASDAVLKALNSDHISLAKQFEALGMAQKVDELANKFTVARDPSNRSAAIYAVPLNVIPGFHNKGIALTGTTQFDSFVL